MKLVALFRIAFIFVAVLNITHCTYIEHARISANHKKIENSISSPKLVDATIFFGKAPLSKAYKFNFINTRNNPFSLVFTVHESSFSDSSLNHLRNNQSHRNSYQINDATKILSTLNRNLPKVNEIAWRNIDQVNIVEAQEGYALMLEYIRYKIREL